MSRLAMGASTPKGGNPGKRNRKASTSRIRGIPYQELPADVYDLTHHVARLCW